MLTQQCFFFLRKLKCVFDLCTIEPFSHHHHHHIFVYLKVDKRNSYIVATDRKVYYFMVGRIRLGT